MGGWGARRVVVAHGLEEQTFRRRCSYRFARIKTCLRCVFSDTIFYCKISQVLTDVDGNVFLTQNPYLKPNHFNNK